MSYGRNFGMRSFENLVRDGRHRVPATGTPFHIGGSVIMDAAAPGFMRLATEAEAPSALAGAVVFEHIQTSGDVLVTSDDSPYDQVPLGAYAQIIHGPGAKVWFKNTAAKTMYDGRVRSAFNFVVDTSGAALTLNVNQLGKGLVPDGAGKWRLTDGTTDAQAGGTAWLLIEQINPATGLVEARFTF